MFLPLASSPSASLGIHPSVSNIQEMVPGIVDNFHSTLQLFVQLLQHSGSRSWSSRNVTNKGQDSVSTKEFQAIPNHRDQSLTPQNARRSNSRGKKVRSHLQLPETERRSAPSPRAWISPHFAHLCMCLLRNTASYLVTSLPILPHKTPINPRAGADP